MATATQDCDTHCPRFHDLRKVVQDSHAVVLQEMRHAAKRYPSEARPPFLEIAEHLLEIGNPLDFLLNSDVSDESRDAMIRFIGPPAEIVHTGRIRIAQVSLARVPRDLLDELASLLRYRSAVELRNEFLYRSGYELARFHRTSSQLELTRILTGSDLRLDQVFDLALVGRVLTGRTSEDERLAFRAALAGLLQAVDKLAPN